MNGARNILYAGFAALTLAALWVTLAFNHRDAAEAEFREPPVDRETPRPATATRQTRPRLARASRQAPPIRQKPARSSTEEIEGLFEIIRPIPRFAVSSGPPPKEAWERVMRKLAEEPSLAHARDKQAQTFLHYAVRFTISPDTVATLLAAGADPDAQDKSGHTPVHIAVQGNNLPALTMLLEAGAAANATNKSDQRPLAFAKTSEAIALLKNYGAF